MHDQIPKIFCYINQYDKNYIKRLNKNIAIIYRNYTKTINHKEINNIKKICKKTKRKFYLANDIKNALKFDFPYIVKPADEGSTFGLSLVISKEEIEGAIKIAGDYSKNILIEEYIAGRELTVGILGAKTLPLVEIISEHQVYDYECKYKPGMSSYFCPAKFNDQITSKIKFDSELIFKALGCKGYGRIDYIIDKNMNYYFLELNTLPGMTSTSLLPIAAKALNISFNDLVHKIVNE